MTDYLETISLTDAKAYLGIDDTSRDGEVTRMIKASLSYLEKATNIHVLDKTKTFYLEDGCVRIYDFPITTSDPADWTVTNKGLYSIYEHSSEESIDLALGYDNVDDIPPDWIECGYAIIECLFEGGKLAELPEMIKMTMRQLKRFVI